MNKRTILATVAGILAVALIATPAYAQRGGGGGGRGGGGFGGGGGRGYGGGGYGGGYGRGGYGGYGYGGYGGYGYGGIGIGIGLGYPAYGGYYGDGYYLGGAYPDYSYSNPTLYGTSPYVGVPMPYMNQPLVGNVPAIQQPGAAAIVSGNRPTMAMQSFYSGPSSAPGTAELTVKVPADAQLWLGSMQSGQQGADRHFSFPSLGQGDNMFSLRTTWTENGQTVTREKQVNVKAGENSTVDFTQAVEQAPPSKPNVGLPAPATAGKTASPRASPPTTPK